jgi:hypothetical protein
MDGEMLQKLSHELTNIRESRELNSGTYEDEAAILNIAIAIF